MKELFLDFIIFIGFCVMVYGVWQISEPMAFIVAGSFLVIFGIIAALIIKLSENK